LNDGIHLIGFNTTNLSKAEIMSGLHEGIQTDGLKLLDIAVQKQEFYSFVSTQTAIGAWRLAASGDGHDDTVIATAIAWWVATMPNAADLVGYF